MDSWIPEKGSSRCKSNFFRRPPYEAGKEQGISSVKDVLGEASEWHRAELRGQAFKRESLMPVL